MKPVLAPHVVDGKETILAVFRCEKCGLLLAFDATLHKPGSKAVYDCPCGREIVPDETFEMDMLNSGKKMVSWFKGYGSTSPKSIFEVPPKLLTKRSNRD
ncbi:MAG: hypothetical protein C5B59_01450 [Bacteroidetes bacterium]|nr:MAG: hypothetical protein C5B59_01450 [Bacteroidota bacterium]